MRVSNGESQPRDGDEFTSISQHYNLPKGKIIGRVLVNNHNCDVSGERQEEVDAENQAWKTHLAVLVEH